MSVDAQLYKYLWKSFKDGKFTDMGIRFQDSHYEIHSVVLCSQSKVFEEMHKTQNPISLDDNEDMDSILFDCLMYFLYNFNYCFQPPPSLITSGPTIKRPGSSNGTVGHERKTSTLSSCSSDCGSLRGKKKKVRRPILPPTPPDTPADDHVNPYRTFTGISSDLNAFKADALFSEAARIARNRRGSPERDASATSTFIPLSHKPSVRAQRAAATCTFTSSAARAPLDASEIELLLDPYGNRLSAKFHAQMYATARKYKIDSLAKSAAAMYEWTLNKNPRDIRGFFESVMSVYNSTPADDRSLRDMAAGHMHKNMEGVDIRMDQRQLLDVISKAPGFAADVSWLFS